MIKAIVETTDGLSEPIAQLYEPQEGGKFRLKVEPAEGFALENIDGLKSALSKERTTREKLEKEAAKYRDLDPDRAREALTKLQELEGIDPEKEADKLAAAKIEAAKRQLIEKHGGEVKQRDERIGSLTKIVENLMVDQVATAALAEARGAVDLLLPHVQKYTRVVERDGSFAVEVLNEDGTTKINGDGKNATIKDLIAEMRASERYGRAFDASGHSGTGKAPVNGAGGAGSRLQRSKMSRAEKAAYLREHGQDAYLKLPR
jgi:hypothetical protein